MHDVRFIALLAALALALVGCARSPRGSAPSLPRGACPEPISLEPGLPIRASSLLGRDLLRASCVRGEAPECRFELEVSAPSSLRAQLESSSFDGALALYRAGDPPRELRCVDDMPPGDVRHARLTASLTPGSYLLVVDGASGEAGEFNLFTELEPLPTLAEVCAQARPLLPATPTRDSTRGGHDLLSVGCGGGGGPEHIYRLSVSEPSRVRVRQQTEHDGTLALRARCEDVASEIACSDDFGSSSRALVTASLAPGTYFVVTDSYAPEQGGDYVLNLQQERAPAPQSAGSVCADAAQRPALTAGRHELDTLVAASALSGSCGGDGAPELALPLRIEVPTVLYARLEQPELNAVIYVRANCEDARSELACRRASQVERVVQKSEAPLRIALAPGAYTLVVDGYEASDMGAATLEIALEAASP